MSPTLNGGSTDDVSRNDFFMQLHNRAKPMTEIFKKQLEAINYHPQSGWFDEGPSKGPPPCGRGLKPPEVLLLLVFFLFLLVADVVPNNGLV